MKAPISEVIENSFEAATHYARYFSEFKSIYKFGKQWSIDNYNKNEPDLDLFAAELTKFKEWSADMERYLN